MERRGADAGAGEAEGVARRAVDGQERGKLIAEVGLRRGGAQDHCCRGKKNWSDTNPK